MSKRSMLPPNVFPLISKTQHADATWVLSTGHAGLGVLPFEFSAPLVIAHLASTRHTSYYRHTPSYGWPVVFYLARPSTPTPAAPPRAKSGPEVFLLSRAVNGVPTVLPRFADWATQVAESLVAGMLHPCLCRPQHGTNFHDTAAKDAQVSPANLLALSFSLFRSNRR